MSRDDMPAETPLSQFTQNVDRWGALQWFERLVNAVKCRNECVTKAREPLEFETWDNIARSSASRLANDYASEVITALASRSAAPATDAEVERAMQLWFGDAYEGGRLLGCSVEFQTSSEEAFRQILARPTPAPHAVEETARPSVPPVAEARDEMIREDERDRLFGEAYEQCRRQRWSVEAICHAVKFWLHARGAMNPAERQRLRAETEASR